MTPRARAEKQAKLILNGYHIRSCLCKAITCSDAKGTVNRLTREIADALTAEREATQKETVAVCRRVLDHVLSLMNDTDFYSKRQFEGLVDKEWLRESTVAIRVRS